MASVKYFLLACVVALVVVKEGHAIKCFVCNSHDDARCSEKAPPEEFLVSCDEQKLGTKFTFCRKTIQIIEFAVNNLPPDTRTIRSCGAIEGAYKNKCYQRSGFGGRQEVCSCSDDACNGSSSVKATFGLLLAAFVVFFARI